MKNKMKVKYILLSIVTAMSLGITVYIIVLGVQSSFDYITELVVLEQNDHYDKMQKHMMRLDNAVHELQDDIDSLRKRQLDTEEDKKLFKKALRNLEEIGLNISRETGFYQEDTTVHIFFEPRGEIIKYFDKTRNTPLYISRFVRGSEMGLFEKNISRKQVDMIIENFENLQSEIESINK